MVDLRKWDLSWGGAICCFSYITTPVVVKNGLVLKTTKSLCLLLKSAGIYKSVTQRPIFLKLIFEVLVHTYRFLSILILFPLNFKTKLYNLSETFAINASNWIHSESSFTNLLSLFLPSKPPIAYNFFPSTATATPKIRISPYSDRKIKYLYLPLSVLYCSYA